jgi:hypothetical protein
MTERCVIPARFNGPATSANGGYACGVLAGAAAGAVPAAADVLPVVTLHGPPPLDAELSLRGAGRRTHVWHGDDLVATVAAAPAAIPVEPAVPAGIAEAGHTGFRGFDFHPFPGCFVCGTARPHGDGLALTPGPVRGTPGTVACTWTPDPADPAVAGPAGGVLPEVVWAVLDCPGGWTADMSRRPRVLGRMTARIDRLPVAGSRHVLVGRSEPAAGRTVTSHTALYTEDGCLLGAASAVWIEVPAGDVPPTGRSVED